MNDFGHKLSGAQQAAIWLSLVWAPTILFSVIVICANWSDAASAVCSVKP